jgi:hypothetical protein
MASTMASSNRDLRFDSLRGLMLVCITVNHLPSLLRPLTDQSLGVFSAAEGFVFLSGLLAGWVYTRRLRTVGPAALRVACQRRAAMIYRWQVASFLGALVLVQGVSHLSGYCSTTSPQLFYSQPFFAALLGATMLSQPGLLDFLPMYCALVLALPFVLRAFEAGYRWRVLGLSFGLWLLMQGAPPIDGAPLDPINVGTFNLFAWQFLFFAGAAIGHARVNTPALPARLRPGLILGATAIAIYGWGVHHLQWRPPWPDALFGIALNKPALGGLRLADFAAVAYLVGVAGTRLPWLLTWRPLAYLGRHSIAVVAAQSVAAIILLQFDALFATPLANWLTTGAAVALLYVVAALHQAWQDRTARRRERTPEPTVFDARHAALLPLDRPHDARAA